MRKFEVYLQSDDPIAGPWFTATLFAETWAAAVELAFELFGAKAVHEIYE
jgi:hypothetical protein